MLRGLSQILSLSLLGEFRIPCKLLFHCQSSLPICLWITKLFRYDAHVLDPLASLQFTTGTYYMLASYIQQLANDLCGGRCVFFLEGGYNLKSLSYSVADSFRAFLGEPSLASEFDNPAILHEEPSTRVRQAIERVKHIHSLWRSHRLGMHTTLHIILYYKDQMQACSVVQILTYKAHSSHL